MHQAIFGTNPIGVGIPTGNGGTPVVLDMATSAYAYFGLLEARTAGKPLPAGVAMDKHGNDTTDAEAALDGGAIKVFDGGYKGSNLSLVVELLAGSLVGAAVEDKLKAKSWGNLIAVIDPELLGSAAAFEERVSAAPRPLAPLPLPNYWAQGRELLESEIILHSAPPPPGQSSSGLACEGFPQPGHVSPPASCLLLESFLPSKEAHPGNAAPYSLLPRRCARCWGASRARRASPGWTPCSCRVSAATHWRPSAWPRTASPWSVICWPGLRSWRRATRAPPVRART